MTIGQQCYYLLGAQPSLCGPPTKKREVVPPIPDSPCCDLFAVPGATRAVLTGGDPAQAPYAGLLVDDFVIGSVNSWKANNKQNGHPGVTMDPTTFPQTVQDTGFVTTIPVCDFTATNPGINCPDIRSPGCAGPGTPQLNSAKPGKIAPKNKTASVHSQLSKPSSTGRTTSSAVKPKPSSKTRSGQAPAPNHNAPAKVPPATPKAPSARPKPATHHNSPRYVFESEDDFQQFVLGITV